MKPCKENKRLIVWLALGALQTKQANSLRVHISGCAGCRRYSEEVAGVCKSCEEHSETHVDVLADDSFHRRLRLRIQDDQREPVLTRALRVVFRQLAGLGTPQTMGASFAVLVALLGLGIGLRNMKTKSEPSSSATAELSRSTRPAVPVRKEESMPLHMTKSADSGLPTLSNYRMIANISLEALDDFLTRQAQAGAGPTQPLNFFVSSRAEIE